MRMAAVAPASNHCIIARAGLRFFVRPLLASAALSLRRLPRQPHIRQCLRLGLRAATRARLLRFATLAADPAPRT